MTIKLIHAIVTDKNGKSITDLTREDFEVYDNSKMMPIAHFEKHWLFLPADKMESVITSGVPSVRSINRKYIFFLDLAHQGFAGIKKAKKAVLHFVDTHLVPADEVAIVAYSNNKGLSLVQNFTSDHQKIKELVGALTSSELVGGIGGLSRELIWDESEEEEEKELSFLLRDSSHLRNLKKEHYINQSRQFCLNIMELAKGVAHLQGTKYIMIFSRGISNEIIYGNLDEERPERPQARLLDLLQKAGQWLTAANCFIFAINTEGAISNHFKNKFLAGDLSLRQLAQLSGGAYFDNIESYKSISKEIHQITSAYYVLGYYIDEKKDGRYHQVEVKVKRKGYRVYSQKGYYDLKPSE